jgi:hypothetical protein
LKYHAADAGGVGPSETEVFCKQKRRADQQARRLRPTSALRTASWNH